MKMFALSLILFSTALAQSISATTTPDPLLTAGGSVSLVFRAPAGQTITLASSNGYQGVRQGSPTGPNVLGFIISLPIIINLPPCGTYSCTPWTPPTPAPGTVVNYWFEVRWFDAGGALHTDFFPFTVGTGGAAIQQSMPATLGANWQLGILDPPRAGSPYIAALSFTTNTGLALPGTGHLALDLDVLFGLCFPTPLPGWATNLQGSLDGLGQSPPINIPIPALAALSCMPIHFQAVVMNPVNGQLMLTPCLDTAIQ